MSRHSHARRRARERLGFGPADLRAIAKAVHGTHGWATSAVSGIRSHFITYRGHRLKVVFDWRSRRLVTVIPVYSHHGSTHSNS